jgi:hypothetical protein
MKTLALIAGIAAIVVLAIWIQYQLWDECRSDHSWLYCMRVLGK